MQYGRMDDRYMGNRMGSRERYMDDGGGGGSFMRREMPGPWSMEYDYRSDYHRYGADARRGYGAMDFDFMRGRRSRVASDQPVNPTFGARGSVAASTTATPYSSRNGEYGDYFDPYSYGYQRDRRGLGSIGRMTSATLPSTYAPRPHTYGGYYRGHDDYCDYDDCDPYMSNGPW